METSACDNTRQNTLSCEVFEKEGHCYADIHHTQYPRKNYRARLEAWWREEDTNKVRVCRALHNAIHASGYVPQKPSREDMVEAVADGTNPWAGVEIQKQIKLGELLLAQPEEGVA